MSDETFYRVIADELESNNMDKVLWTQAFANAEGDPDKTKANYIRLRYLALKKSAPSVSPLLTQGSQRELPPVIGGLARLRAELSEKLRIQGKSSLYTTLNLTPSADDSVVSSALAAFDSKIQNGSITASAEFKYAKETLGNPALREQYDRKLMEALIEGGRAQVVQPSYEPATYEYEGGFMSWWGSGKTTVIMGVLSVALLGYLALGFIKARGAHEVQKDAMSVQHEAVGVVGEIESSRVMNEKLRIEAEANLRNRSLSIQEMNADRQRQEMENRLYMQRQEQERRSVLEQERLKVQQQQNEDRRAQRERQYYACMNTQLNNVYQSEAENRCKGLR